ncbi:hypothetical protein XCM_2720 [Xanthomonas citri pv. mangiferaeindicae]|nr:hypothetical protein XCM_2720 [Xanthomonas citri pv. mangiferaeindicae]
MPGFCRFGIVVSGVCERVAKMALETECDQHERRCATRYHRTPGNKKGPIFRSDLLCLAAPDGFEPPNA